MGWTAIRPRQRHHHSNGFTIIEVVLFIAISGFLIVGLMVGTSATVARERYNDSVQDFAEYFRREYSAVINPQNGRIENISSSMCNSAVTSGDPDRGRSGCLLYGRLITIGEESSGNVIRSYDIIGKELTICTGSALDEKNCVSETADIKSALKLANINAIMCGYGNNSATAVGQYQYSLQWLARAESTRRNEDTNTSNRAVKYSILIARSPVNGSVHTLVLNGTAIPVQTVINSSCTSGIATNLIADRLPSFSTTEDVEICVGSEDIFAVGSKRRNIRITRDGHNGSAVQLIDQDSEENKCQ